jgi:NAD(P)-dependent dehydrogenase (short-subunit alcohol dehydrogenase family)
MSLLDGRVALVTGAGRGIGRGEALELARSGAAVVVNELDAEAGEQVVATIRSEGGTALLDTGDVSDPAAAEAMVRRAVDDLGGLDALVNNAGILRDRTLIKMTPQEWDAVIAVHLRGHYAPTRAACAYWREQYEAGTPRAGRVVCTASTSGLLGNFGQSNYGTAKAGIAAFATIVAQEVGRYGVTVNAIAPAARTRMTEGAYGDVFGSEGDFDFWAPENVAPFVAYLCSEAAGGISGKVFGVQGDTVEIYRPWTSAAVIGNGGRRWSPDDFVDRVQTLFDDSGIAPEAEAMMRRLRYSMTTRR